VPSFDEAEADPLHQYLFAVPDLRVENAWSLGTVRLHPAGHARLVIDEMRQERGWRHNWYDDFLDKKLETFDNGAIAEVPGVNERSAYKVGADAMGVLRLFAALRSPRTNTQWQTFGLEGQVPRWLVNYIDIDNGPTMGFFRGGAVPGWQFATQDHAAFCENPGFRYLASCVGLSPGRTTAMRRRLILGLRLFNNAILDYDADRKLLSMVNALEVLFADDDWQGKAYGLARRAAFVSCSVPTGSMCGRDRASCPYIAVDPGKRVPQALKDLVKRSETDVSVLCHHYRFAFDLYQWRNDAVHEGTSHRDFKEVEHAAWEVAQWILPPLLTWCAEHPEDDIGAIEQDINQVVQNRPPDLILT